MWGTNVIFGLRLWVSSPCIASRFEPSSEFTQSKMGSQATSWIIEHYFKKRRRKKRDEKNLCVRGEEICMSQHCGSFWTKKVQWLWYIITIIEQSIKTEILCTYRHWWLSKSLFQANFTSHMRPFFRRWHWLKPNVKYQSSFGSNAGVPLKSWPNIFP